eukprot:1593336-Rhodomonas_salina.1
MLHSHSRPLPSSLSPLACALSAWTCKLRRREPPAWTLAAHSRREGETSSQRRGGRDSEERMRWCGGGWKRWWLCGSSRRWHAGSAWGRETAGVGCRGGGCLGRVPLLLPASTPGQRRIDGERRRACHHEKGPFRTLSSKR